MDRVKDEQITVTHRVHEFYCDDCGKLLGSCVECDDGYYKQFGEYERSAFVSRNRMKLKKHLCDKCALAMTQKIEAALRELGFRPEDEDE